MKTKILLPIILMICGLTSGYSQIKVSAIMASSDGYADPVIDLATGKDVEVPKDTKEMKSLTFLCNNLKAGHKLTIIIANESRDYTTAGQKMKLDFLNDILDKEVVIKHFDATPTEIAADEIKFRVVRANMKPTTPKSTDLVYSIDDYLARNYAGLKSTPFGYVDPTSKEQEIHIFFDYFGNSLLSTVPSGISNAQYIVHVIYPFSNSDPNKVSYSIRQKTGTFSNALLFNNTNIRNGFEFQSGEEYDGITERKFLLGTSTDDLTFDIIAAIKDNAITKTVLETYTIKMSPVYHGSFDIGFVKTNLSNPTYNLVQDPNSANQVVNQTDESPKGVVTVMASFYVSPVILLRSVFGKKEIPFYKLTGRSFLDDHKFYERFYPTIGVGISDKAFENIFYGINWEIARGLSVFGGWHYGKVRTFEMPNFQAGVTPVTNQEFEFYQNTRWKTSTAVGVKLDVMIVRNLFADN